MARGLEKNLKRLNAPKHGCLTNLVAHLYAPKPSSGPHKSRECSPLILILRNRLKYALTYREVIAILMQRHAIVDGKMGFGVCFFNDLVSDGKCLLAREHEVGYRSLCLPSLRYACLESSLCDEMLRVPFLNPEIGGCFEGEPKACLLAFNGGSVVFVCRHWDVNSILLPSPSTIYLHDIDVYSSEVTGDENEFIRVLKLGVRNEHIGWDVYVTRHLHFLLKQEL
ncbi:hypothetical protein DKX38_022756 [Salix brachista]|uniref:Small ribosomal subunit protein eS4 N-terminal domain-containing protein n=1 Tax=Salix brachista TaxID=2182728 RepID=A0A5N5KBQ5_9ROSI|nr:hypothetical protein DKX38_022756 [Salix brachista]